MRDLYFMKKILLAFILHFNYLLFPQWYSNWGYRKIITNNLAQGGDLTDFPLLVIISNDSDLANYASNNGYDILFTPGVNTNKLAHEIEYYSNGTVIAWVKMPYFSASVQASNTLFIYFDKNKTGNQQNSNGVWDSDYYMTHHLAETGGTHYDSTVNGRIGTWNFISGTSTMNTNGKIGGADYFDGSGDYVKLPILTNTNITIEAWIYKSSKDTVNADTAFGSWKWASPIISNDGFDFARFYQTTPDNCAFTVITSNTATEIKTSRSATFTFSDSTLQWIYVCGTYDSVSGKGRLWINGTNISTFSAGAGDVMTRYTASTFMRIGSSSVNSGDFHGFVDEVRLSISARSTNYIFNSYCNQVNPTAFYTIGSLNEYGVPSVSVSALASPPAVAGQSASFSVSADTAGTGAVTNLLINFGDGSLENHAVNGSLISGTYTHTYTSGNTFLLSAAAFSDSGKVRTNQIFITPAPFSMPAASNIRSWYVNEGFKITFSQPAANINRAVIYRDSLQLASISPVAPDMEYTDRYLLYHTVYTYQIGMEYSTGMIISTNISNLPLRPELAQKTLGIKGGTVANLIAELDIPAGALSADTIISMHIQTNLLYNFQPGYVSAYNQVRIETTPPVQFSESIRLTMRVPFYNNKIRMIPDDGNYDRIFAGNENRLCLAAYSDARAWVPVYSRVSDQNILPNFSYKLLTMNLSSAGTFGVSVVVNADDYENKVVVKNRVFAPQSGIDAMSRVMIFFPNPAFEDVRLQIYRMDGQKVYERHAEGSVSMVSWNGAADNGRMADSGLYIASITRGGKIRDTYRVKIYLLK